ncbi:MAG: hypothetical protein ABI743_12485, partial [bacterium]
GSWAAAYRDFVAIAEKGEHTGSEFHVWLAQHLFEESASLKRWLMDRSVSNSSEHDGRIVYLAGGALLFSSGILQNELVHTNPISTTILWLAWVALATSLIAVSWSNFQAGQMLNAMLKALGETDQPMAIDRIQAIDKITGHLNITAMIALTIGLVLLGAATLAGLN